MNFRVWIFFLWFICLGFLSKASKVVVLTDDHINKPIKINGVYLDVLEDTTRTWTFEEMISKFGRSDSLGGFVNATNNRVRTADYWGRFTVNNTATKIGSWMMEFPDSHIEKLELIICSEEGEVLHHPVSGSMFAHGETRFFRHKNFQFELPTSYQRVVVYFKAYSESPVRFSLLLRSNKQFVDHALQEYILLGIFYGFVLLIIMLNVFLYLRLKDRANLYYAFYALSICLVAMCQDGIGFQFIWPNFPEFNRLIFPQALYLVVLFELLYIRSFLNTEKELPATDKLITWTIGIRSVWLLVGLMFLPDLRNFIPLDIIPLIIALYTGIEGYRNGQKYARLYIIGFSCFLLGHLVYGLYYVNVIPEGVVPAYAFNFGALLELTFLSLAFADRLRTERVLREENQRQVMTMKDELIHELREKEQMKENINRQLEQQVRERTLELNSKADELEVANETLKSQADRLDELNKLLDLDNYKLKKDVKEIAKARVMKHNVDFEEFKLVYPNKESCFRLLEEHKWKEGYNCVKCGNEKYLKGAGYLSRRCTKCGFNESVTRGTIFQGIKIPIGKGFYMLFLIYSCDNKISATELSETVDLSVKSCSAFKKRIQGAMDKSTHQSSWTDLIFKN